MLLHLPETMKSLISEVLSLEASMQKTKKQTHTWKKFIYSFKKKRDNMYKMLYKSICTEDTIIYCNMWISKIFEISDEIFELNFSFLVISDVLESYFLIMYLLLCKYI